jgi:hypothetical protein
MDNDSTKRTSPHYAWVILTVTLMGLLMAQGVRLAFWEHLDWLDSKSGVS